MVIFQRNWVTIYSWVLSGSQCAKVIKVRDLHQHIASSTPAAMLQIHVPLSSTSINLYPSKSGVAPQPCGTDISGASTYRVMAMDRTTSTHTNAPCGVWSSLSSHWFCRKLRLVSTACLVPNISQCHVTKWIRRSVWSFLWADAFLMKSVKITNSFHRLASILWHQHPSTKSYRNIQYINNP